MGSKICDLPVICPWGAFAFQEAKFAPSLLGALSLRSFGPLDPEDVLGAELGVGLNTGTASGGISPMNRQKLPNLPNAAFRAPQRTRNTHQAHVPGHEPVIYFPNKHLSYLTSPSAPKHSHSQPASCFAGYLVKCQK